ncbi:MAG: hypothetical protein R6U98_20720 [Pirellulaceae bacterium]
MGRKKNELAETVWRDRLARFDRSDLKTKADMLIFGLVFAVGLRA